MGSSPGPLPAAEITGRLSARFGDDVLEASEALDQATVTVTRSRYHDVAETLRSDPEFAFDFCEFVSAVDAGDGAFDVILQLWSTTRHHQARVKTRCEGEELTVPTVSDLWPGANWHERETWELFGIRFEGHPQLVKLLLPEQFEGNPMRKDFVLMSRVAKPWPGEEKAE